MTWRNGAGGAILFLMGRMANGLWPLNRKKRGSLPQEEGKELNGRKRKTAVG